MAEAWHSNVVFLICFLQLWKRSGAWFFKGLPKYMLPIKRGGGSKYAQGPGGTKTSKAERGNGTRSYNTWSRTRDKSTYFHSGVSKGWASIFKKGA